ncbi:MAG TPA: hypothetical protein VF165_14595 [Nocardioidaceae bacterium]
MAFKILVTGRNVGRRADVVTASVRTVSSDVCMTFVPGLHEPERSICCGEAGAGERRE